MPGTLKLGHGGEAHVGWAEPPRIVLDLELRPRGATVYFALSARATRSASVEVNYVAFDEARPGSGEQHRVPGRGDRRARASAGPSRGRRYDRSGSLLDQAHAQRLGDRMHAVDGVELLRRIGEILVGGVHRQFQEARDLLAGIAVGGELQAFELALRDRREFARFRRAASLTTASNSEKQRAWMSNIPSGASAISVPRKTIRPHWPRSACTGKAMPDVPPTSGSVRLAQSSASNDAVEAPEPGTSFHQQGTRGDAGVADDAGAVAAGDPPGDARRRAG